MSPDQARALDALPLAGLLLVAFTACGEDARPTGGSGAAAGVGGATAGAAGAAPSAGGTSVGGGPSGGVGGAGASGAASGGASGGLICPSSGVKLPSGACYVPCTYAFGAPPRYESPAGNCTQLGWRCSVYQYCDPNIHCATDQGCQTIGGSGLVCVPSGPLVGECLIKCNTNADCPNSNGATTSPYVCQAIDTGAGVVHVCGF